jgi:hypothetical protein
LSKNVRAYELKENPMPTKSGAIHPALWHGGYSTTALLPTESREAFEKLHRELIAELAPSGALEDDIVMTVARLVWRKQNLRTLRIAQSAQAWCSVTEQMALNYTLPNDRDRDALGENYELVELGETATFDGLTKELEVKERLDAGIGKCLKQLLFLRGLKSISPAPSATSPKRIAKSSKAA